MDKWSLRNHHRVYQSISYFSFRSWFNRWGWHRRMQRTNTWNVIWLLHRNHFTIGVSYMETRDHKWDDNDACHCENNSWLYFDVMIILSSSKCCIQWQVHVKRHACHSHKKTSCIVNLIQHAALHIMLAASLQHLIITIYPLIVDIQQCYTICLGQLLFDMQYVLSKNLHRWLQNSSKHIQLCAERRFQYICKHWMHVGVKNSLGKCSFAFHYIFFGQDESKPRFLPCFFLGTVHALSY